MKVSVFANSLFSDIEIPKDIVAQLTLLTGSVEDYIQVEGESIEYIDINNIYPSRIRLDGVISANKRMLETRDKIRNKRSPIALNKIHAKNAFNSENIYSILDGNSTFINFLISGFKKIPVIILE